MLSRTMKRTYVAFQEDILPYAGLKAARESHAELQRLSLVPGHICSRPDLQILLGHRRFSKVPWLIPMIEILPLSSTRHLRAWGFSSVLVLSKQYHKIVHMWDSITTLAELWHPQTHTFVFPGFEATILLEELEVMLGLPKYQRGEEVALSYTVAPINTWGILGAITTKKTDLHSMTSRNHVHLLPIAQWVISQYKHKTENYLAIAKAAAICICGVILFPAEDGAISFSNLSIIDSISEGMYIGQAVLGYLYAGLSSAATGGPFYGSAVALELWMGMHIQFRAMDTLSTECKTMLHHPLAFVGAPLYMTPQAWCKTAHVKGLKGWRNYFKNMTAAGFDMHPRFLHNRMIYLPQRPRLALRLLGNEALVQYNQDRCYLQCGAAGTVVPRLSHYPPIQVQTMDDAQDERDESLGLYDVGKQVGETVDGQLQRLTRGCRAVLAEEPGAGANLELRRFLILFLGRLLFATRGDAVYCRFLLLLEDLDEVDNYAWGAAFLAHQFDSLDTSER
ncbi:hypothetical protein Taro_054106 [Colocasia esculenta]|uniref:Aminotransferase-like plant mobile domain-containing protein n=1 Tax=Colocasia esculenta TaxID=4460 RepID=A0A843XMV2_COLES|nr:hypothetical protein [Colocasia esculenta]